ncbi:MAG: type 1 glutamine amidotransferase [Betaproteobacteria bacterium]|jgi:GMP synthase-like glutamine amidotransferase
MTRTLLINCYHQSEKNNVLRDTLNKFTNCRVVSYEKIQSGYQIPSGINAVVISGSEARIVNPQDKAKYEGVTQLIRNCQLPLFAICFGHQLLCSAFNAKTGTLPQPVIDKFEKVNVLQTGDIFARFKQGQKLELAQWHNDYVLKESLDDADFKLLADSASCPVEAVKHKTRLLFGVQFHPERITITNHQHPEGHKIIENFYINNVVRLGL